MTIRKLPGQLSNVQTFVIAPEGLDQIIRGIPDEYTVIGPVEEKWAVNLAPIESMSDLALGVGATERRATYRLDKKQGSADLTVTRPMNSPKSFNFRSREELLHTRRTNDGCTYESPEIKAEKKAFFGIHACDVAGMFVLDRTFERRYRDRAYDALRADTLVVGVNCFEPGANCFCSTFDAGPDLKGGFDIGLSWLGDQYLVEVGTEMGAAIMAGVDKKHAPAHMETAKKEKTAAARRKMTKAFDLKKALTVLNDNYDHPYWAEPSERCLSCANCINVCPTCYCYRLADHSSVDREVTTRVRLWDACQHLEFASVHGGNFRPERVDRIRQWVNHKINWTIEQYGVAGCVGCGRCVTWCPTAIDITEPVWRLGGKDLDLTA